ncbi:MAG TPA: Gfo/Idh/MocA family oxidoreductase, partial [Chthoniobacterales bacterium]|nr:Gfo/Idh/MocA family oxidoreductase [Chthoniobacterales bacterium]
MVRNGELGEIKAVQVEHASGWASKLQEDEKKNEPSWRMNPTRLGDASLLLDLGTHAHHLACFVTGLDVTQVVGELSTIVPGRAIKDSGHALLRFENEARGTMWISMAAAGNEQGIRIRVYGDKGSLEWFHEGSFSLAVLLCEWSGANIRARHRLRFGRSTQVDSWRTRSSGRILRSVR